MVVVAVASRTALGARPAPGMLDAPCPVMPARPAELDAQTELDLRPERPDRAGSARTLEPATRAYLAALDQQRKGDWAGRCRFQTDDAVIARGSAARVEFLGDSITENWLLADPSFFTGGIVNRGISGQTSPQMLVRFRMQYGRPGGATGGHQARQAKALQAQRDGLHMTVGRRSNRLEGLLHGLQGVAAQGGSNGFDLRARQARQVGQGAFEDLGALAVGLSQQHRRRRAPVRYDMDVHAYKYKTSQMKHQAFNMPTL